MLSFCTFMMRHQRLLGSIFELTPSVMAVVLEIASHTNGCWVSREGIQANTGLSDGSVKIAFRKLKMMTFNGYPLLRLTRHARGEVSPGSIWIKDLPGFRRIWKSVRGVPYQKRPTAIKRLKNRIGQLDLDEYRTGQSGYDEGQQAALSHVRGGGNGCSHSGGNGLPPTDHWTSLPESLPPSEDECFPWDDDRACADPADHGEAGSRSDPDEVGSQDQPAGADGQESPVKLCSKCGRYKPATPGHFHRDRKVKHDGLRRVCRECWNQYQRSKAKEERMEGYRRRREEFYEEHPELALAKESGPEVNHE